MQFELKKNPQSNIVVSQLR